MVQACTCFGSEVSEPEPVLVEEAAGHRLVPAGRFGHCACLARHIEDAGLVTGARCRIDLA